MCRNETYMIELAGALICVAFHPLPHRGQAPPLPALAATKLLLPFAGLLLLAGLTLLH